MITNETLLVILIGIDYLQAILKYIEAFFTNQWLSQEKVFQKDNLFKPIYIVIIQLIYYKPKQDKRARLILKNTA